MQENGHNSALGQGPLYSDSLAGAAGASSALAESAAVSRSALDRRAGGGGVFGSKSLILFPIVNN